jgi:Protein of unknown function (DUF2510)
VTDQVPRERSGLSRPPYSKTGSTRTRAPRGPCASAIEAIRFAVAMTRSGPLRRRQSPTGEWQYQGADGYWYDEEPVARGAHAASTSRSARTSPSSSIPAGAWLVILGGALTAVGTLLPWVTAGVGTATLNRNAFQLGSGHSVTWTGPVIISLAIIAVLIGNTRLVDTAMPIGVQTSVLVLGIVLAICCALSYPVAPAVLKAGTSAGGLNSYWSIGFGFWLCLTGSLIVADGGWVMRLRAKADAKLLAVPNHDDLDVEPENEPIGRHARRESPERALSPAQGWYSDPGDPSLFRWWTGAAWSKETKPVGGH